MEIIKIEKGFEIHLTEAEYNDALFQTGITRGKELANDIRIDNLNKTIHRLQGELDYAAVSRPRLGVNIK